MPQQSTNHLFMIEPAVFYANPETMETNVYQVEEHGEDHNTLLTQARDEFRAYRDTLVEHGVTITTTLGLPDCPDMVFPNCMSTHREDSGDGTLILYPMLNKNRQTERTPELVDLLRRHYQNIEDWSHYESEGRALESTASIVMDRVNRIGYAGLSARTDKDLMEKWCADMGYRAIPFETASHTGKPVYHTDYLMFIGTNIAAICFECIKPEYRETVRASLSATHEIVELSMEQLQNSCGNGLEVIGTGGERMLTLSDNALHSLTDGQLAALRKDYNTIITSPLPTLEKFGGGSARCMLMELF